MAFFKWLLPLAIVMSIVMMAPSLEEALGDVGLTILSGALLSLVFLRQACKSGFLPALVSPVSTRFIPIPIWFVWCCSFGFWWAPTPMPGPRLGPWSWSPGV